MEGCQTMSLINTVNYFLQSKDILNALRVIETNIELLANYVYVPEELIDFQVLKTADLYTLCKMAIVRGDTELVLKYAIIILRIDQTVFDENSFYNIRIKHRLIDSLIANNNVIIRDYFVKQVEMLPEVTISTLGFLYEIGEYGMLKTKLISYCSSNIITVELLEFIRGIDNDELQRGLCENPEVVATIFNGGSAEQVLIGILGLFIDKYGKENKVEFITKCLGAVSPRWGYYAAFYIHQNYRDAAVCDNVDENIRLVVEGKINTYLIDFMVLNNQTNFLLLEQMGKAGCPYFGFCHSIMNAHTTNDSFYRTNRYNKSQEWNRFIDLGGLGLVHIQSPFEILGEILPATSGNGEPSAIVSLGLIGSNAITMYGGDNSLRKEIEGYVWGILDQNKVPETVLFGSFLCLGIVKYSSGDYDAFAKLKDPFEKYSTISQETAGYAAGLLFANTSDITVIEYLKSIRNTTDFKRLVRVINVALAMISGDMSAPELDNNDVVVIEETILRLGVNYVNSNEACIIDYLLKYVNHSNDDIKRAAVISLGMVIGYHEESIREIMIPLSTSHAMYVRAAVALSLGFFSTEVTDVGLKADIINLLEALIFDSEDLVKQQAGIGLGIALQQHNTNLYGTKDCATVNYKRICKMMNGIIGNRNDSRSYKIGVGLGRSLIELGGRNAVLSLRNISGRIDNMRVHGYLLFTQSWYWNPLYNFLSLLVLPTPCIRVDKSLQLAQTTGIQSGYRELFVFMQETKRSRRFKKTNGERFNDVVKEFVGEVKNNTRINYRDILMKGRYNLIDFM